MRVIYRSLALAGVILSTNSSCTLPDRMLVARGSAMFLSSSLPRVLEQELAQSDLPQPIRAILPDLYSGPEPTNDTHFAALERLGVRTILSVDGSAPDVETARRFGMRTVHVPLGYDGVTPASARAISRVASETKAPHYVHCHRGIHRGPTAAALLAMSLGLPAGRGRAFLEKSGTSRDYPGLWRALDEFRHLSANASHPVDRAPLPERVEVSSLRLAMAFVGRSFERLERCREAGWTTPPAHPDVVPAHEATILREGFQEAVRALDVGADPELVRAMQESLQLSLGLERSLDRRDSASASMNLAELQRACQSCHDPHRDGR